MEQDLQNLEKIAERIRQESELARVYFARRVGRRMHFLAGAGKQQLSTTEHACVQEDLHLFWQTRGKPGIAPDMDQVRTLNSGQ